MGRRYYPRQEEDSAMRSSSTLQLAVALIRGKCSKYTNVIYISTETQLLIQYFLPLGEEETDRERERGSGDGE